MKYLTLVFCLAAFLVMHGRLRGDSPIAIVKEGGMTFDVLFNGENLNGWKHQGNWKVEDGVIAWQSEGGMLTYVDQKVPDNFELRFEWKVAQGSNSGVYYRPGNYEYQVLDNTTHPDGKNPRTSAGSLYFCMQPSKDVTRSVGQWNEGRIVCKGTVIQHWLNGTKIVDFDYTDKRWAFNIDMMAKRGTNVFARGGSLLLQDHKDPVWYRNLRMRAIPEDEDIGHSEVVPAVMSQESLDWEAAKLASTVRHRAKSKAAAEAARTSRPNILWLIGEDLSPHLGCYGTPEVHTPNLDRLGSDGMRYTRAFTTSPVCSTSRSAFMTGMYQTTIGAHQHRSHRDDGFTLPDGVRVLTDRMRDAGYFTANVVRFPDAVDFQGAGKTDWNFTYKGQPFDTDDWQELKFHQPFYAQVNFSETHRTRTTMETEGRGFDAPRRADPAKVKLPPYYPDHPEARSDWANYLDSATELDRKIGQVLRQLKQDGLADNTIVIFFGDHGAAHVRSKQWCYDSGLRIPLLIHCPEKLQNPSGFKPGTVSDQIVEAIDFSATTLSLAGVPTPATMQGQAFLGEYAGPPREFAFAARDRCDETVDRIRSVRDARYRYIRNFMPERPFLQLNAYKEAMYPMIGLMRRLHAQGKLNEVQEVLLAPHRPSEELYDLESDPDEVHNLADSDLPEYQSVRKRLADTLDEWIESSADQGRTPESPEVIQYWQKKMKTVYDQPAVAK